MGHEPITAASGAAGVEAFRQRPADFVITDLKMEGLSGVEVLRAIAAVDPDVPIMLITAYGTVETAVEAMKLGAFDFLTKPFAPEVVRLKVERALELCAARRARNKLEAENEYLRGEDEHRFHELIGTSDKMAAVRKAIDKVAAAETVVFIAGESGTGKELVARAIHKLSRRAAGPFIKVNCGALTETLLESELFGHERGAFTGAIARRDGRFSLADGGTLFLDEIGEMALDLQVKILRAIQERVVIRVGDTRPENVDIRILAATNRDLEKEIAAGRFREDLYYRLNVVNVHLPPLRERGEDVLVIARYLLSRYAREFDAKVKGFSPNATVAIRKYNWPGNIRELENRIKKAVVLCDSSVIGPDDLGLVGDTLPQILTLADAKEKFQRDYINEVLALNNGNRTKTARDLGVDPRTIFRHLEKEADSPPGSVDEGGPE